jgi:hypothetical protein
MIPEIHNAKENNDWPPLNSLKKEQHNEPFARRLPQQLHDQQLDRLETGLLDCDVQLFLPIAFRVWWSCAAIGMRFTVWIVHCVRQKCYDLE